MAGRHGGHQPSLLPAAALPLPGQQLPPQAAHILTSLAWSDFHTQLDWENALGVMRCQKKVLMLTCELDSLGRRVSSVSEGLPGVPGNDEAGYNYGYTDLQ